MIILITTIIIFFNNFLKNSNYSFISNFKYNNSFWDYVAILNNNNKSFSLFLVFLVFLTFLNKNLKLASKIIFILLIFLYFYSNKTLSINLNILINKFNTINMNLTNGLILIHPLCVYFVYAIFIKNIFIKLNCKSIKILHNIKSNFDISLIVCYVALFLGSYWSQQELNWGGWWNWDFVEIIALIFFIIGSIVIHINLKKNLNSIFYITRKIINSLLLFFFLIRLDFLNSIHSFNSFSNENFSINLILYIYIIFIIVVVFNNNYNKYYIYVNNKIKNNNVVLLFLILLFTFNIYIYISIILTFLFDTQYIELTKYLKNFFNSIILLFFLLIIKNNKLLFILFSINNNFIIFYFIILIIIIKIIYNNKYNYKNIFHIFIIIFIIINNFYYNYQYYSLNLNLIKSNLSLMNNINTLNNSYSYLMYLYYYNNNNYLNILNNYYCYNNNILFNRVFSETLLNNILLNITTIINYKIEKIDLNYNFNVLYLYYIWFILIIFTNLLLKLKFIR